MREGRTKARLYEKIREDTGLIPVPGTLKRTHAGRTDLAAGVWSWTVSVYAPGPGGTELWGSGDPMGECVKPGRRLYKDKEAHEIGYE